MSGVFTESTVEDPALAWLEAIGWRIAHLQAARVVTCLRSQHRQAQQVGGPEMAAGAPQGSGLSISRPISFRSAAL